jgi:protein-L-isoaspartate O-methyltransferase
MSSHTDSPPVDPAHTERLRWALVEQLITDGHLRSPAWRDAFLEVPRHPFVPRLFTPTPDGRGYEPVDGHRPDQREVWMDLVHSDEALVTQLDGDDAAWETACAQGVVAGAPTCSSTMPGLMAPMLEALDISEQDTVLEIGAGTGYNAALLCARLGSSQVVSVDVDGSHGYPPRAPYDRIIATRSIRRVPAAWLAQTRRGGLILVNLHRSLHGGALVRLEAVGNGKVSGNFLRDYGSFMPVRAQPAPDPVALYRKARRRRGSTRTTGMSGDMLTDEFLFHASLAMADTNLLRSQAGEDTERDTWLLADDGSWAFSYRVGNCLLAEQRGPRNLWNELETAFYRWRELGEPGYDRYGLTVTVDGRHVIWVDRADCGPSWELPE